ncbi:MAG: M28 family peptidase, partial [Rhodothermales bacterium]|nr:M28 family peptidase [Rhodothermales bacterium]
MTTVAAQSLDAAELLDHVRYLASDELLGRETGEPGADSAAAYLETQFAALGLDPLFETGYRQPFEVATTVAVGSDSRLSVNTPIKEHRLLLGRDWYPFSFSSSGPVSGRMLEAGYGLEDGDFAGARPQIKRIAMIDGGTPEGMHGHGGVDASLRRRATLAREAGLKAVAIKVTKLSLPEVGSRPSPIGIPAIQIVDNEHTAAALSHEYARFHGMVEVNPVIATGYNVGGIIRGTSHRDRIIVVGAHYDHLGLGGPGSLAPDAVEPHNGADDNASGTAVLLGLAEHFARPENRPSATIVFVGFSGEEMGLLGSDHFASEPPFDLSNVIAMINFDMVGRLDEGKLQRLGTETATEFTDILDEAAAGRDLTVSRVGDGYGPSDQTSFYSRGVPVLHFFSGTHSQYHRPEDDWELINAEGMAEIGEMAIAIINILATRSEALTFVEQQRPQQGGGGYGPYLGTIPDFGEVEG